MVITHKVNMDLIRRGITPRIDIVQDDKYSRNLNIRLYENGVAFLPPDGCHALIRYSKPDRTGAPMTPCRMEQRLGKLKTTS